MIWSDRTLREHQACVIDGYNAAHVNPASYDLTLSNVLRRVHPIWAMPDLAGDDSLPRWGDPETFTEAWLGPGEFILCASAETVSIPLDCVALLFCKSSAGRNGLEHLPAGLGDPGFTGQWTWELHNVAPWPIRLIAGQRLMQHVIMTLDQRALIPYRGQRSLPGSARLHAGTAGGALMAVAGSATSAYRVQIVGGELQVTADH